MISKYLIISSDIEFCLAFCIVLSPYTHVTNDWVLGFVCNSNHWCGSSPSGLLHKLWEDPILLLGYRRARKIRWSERWLLVSVCDLASNWFIVTILNPAYSGIYVCFSFGFYGVAYFVWESLIQCFVTYWSKYLENFAPFQALVSVAC